MQPKIYKVIAALLAVTIMYASFLPVLSYAADSLITASELENQKTTTNNKNVEFDVYYDDNIHSKSIDIDSTDTKLNILLNVKEAGYLKDISVSFADSNFLISNTEENIDAIKSFDEAKKLIEFNQINSGSNIIKSINISADKKDQINEDMLSKDNEISLTATYINEDGEEEHISKTIVVHTGWKTETGKAVVSYETIKYIPYVANGNNKLIIQGKVTSGLETNLLPIKNTEINIIAPQINNSYPESVTVIANNTLATNGDETGINFTTQNWTYDKDSGKITINVENTPYEGKISWKKNVLDEYIVTYIYSSEVYEAIKDKPVEVNYDVQAKMSLYNDGTGTTNLEASVNGYTTQQEKLGDIINITTNTSESLNKGYMYNNKETAEENKRETEYTVSYTAEVAYASIIDKISIEQQIDAFVTDSSENLTTISGTNYAYNKQIKVLESEFKKVLGENGTINILNGDTSIATMNKDTTITDGYYIVDLSSFNVNNISIETSKPEKEGSLTINVVKAIAKDIDYSENQIKKFTNIKTSVIGRAYNVETLISEITGESLIKLDEPTQKVSITANKESLSTIIENKDVEIKATLENDSIDDLMFENPTVTINLPTNIENISIKEAKLYFDDELQIVNSNLIDNTDGTKSIVTTLSGKQTKYNNVAAKGATLSFIADITLNKLTPTTQTQIGLVVDNGDENKTQTTASYNISYIAPTGVVTTNAIDNYMPDGETLMSISGEEKEVLIPTLAKTQNPTFTMTVINNYSYDLSNVVVLGRTPFEGNKNPDTFEDLGSTMTLPLTSSVYVSGTNAPVTVYYSENSEATTDLSNSTNGWSTEFSDISTIKSYMIVLNDQIMKPGESFTFSYTANISADLQYNMSAYETYVVYFNSNINGGSIADKAISTPIGVTTGIGPAIDAKLESIMDSEAITSGSVLKLRLSVFNSGSETAKNLKMSIPVDETVRYVEEDASTSLGYNFVNAINVYVEGEGEEAKLNYILELDLGDLEPNATLTKDIWLLITDGQDIDSDKQKEFEFISTVYNDILKTETNSVKCIISKTYFKGTVSSIYTQIKEQEEYTMNVSFVSSTNQNRDNVDVIIDIPDQLELKSVLNRDKDITNSCVVQGNQLIIHFDTVGETYTQLNITFNSKKITSGNYEENINLEAKVRYNNNIETIGKTNVKIVKPTLYISQVSSIPANTPIKTSEQFTYIFTIKNPTSVAINDIEFIDYIPNDVIYQNTELVYSTGKTTIITEKDDEGNVTAFVGGLEANSEVTIKVNVLAGKADSEITVKNSGCIIQPEVGKIDSNEVNNIIRAYSPSDSSNPPSEEVRKITGNIWLDENGDGIKDENEMKFSNIEILLLDNKTGNIAKDIDGIELITKTDDNGDYAFSNICQGLYTVIFFYDSANYSTTTYRKDGVDTSKNSDAMDKEVVYEGETKRAAVTEEIILTSSNAYNIDLGLVEDKKFDLSLDKIVKNITVNNDSGTKTTKFDKELAKIDIEAKDIKSSTMVVEYTIKVTNEGAIPGYAKRIADYIPENLRFNSEINTDWYEGSDGMIYNTSLANTIINPGESKEVTLILTMNVTDDSFGMITNNAEIMESSNDYGLKDVDSTAGNKSTNEDDYSTANILLGIKTGEIFIYFILSLTIITIIGVGTYIIRKRVLK